MLFRVGIDDRRATFYLASEMGKNTRYIHSFTCGGLSVVKEVPSGSETGKTTGPPPFALWREWQPEILRYLARLKVAIHILGFRSVSQLGRVLG